MAGATAGPGATTIVGQGTDPVAGTTMTLEPITARETAAADKAGRTRTRKETRIRGGGTAGITAMAMMTTAQDTAVDIITETTIRCATPCTVDDIW
jgi:hypothetical protein